MGQLPARKQAQKYMADPATLGRVCWAVVTAGWWPGVPGRRWHGTRATAQSDAPCAERGSGRCGRRCGRCRLPSVPKADAGAWCSGTACGVQTERVMAPTIGPSSPLPLPLFCSVCVCVCRDGRCWKFGDRQSGSNLLLDGSTAEGLARRRNCPPASFCTPFHPRPSAHILCEHVPM